MKQDDNVTNELDLLRRNGYSVYHEETFEQKGNNVHVFRIEKLAERVYISGSITIKTLTK